MTPLRQNSCVYFLRCANINQVTYWYIEVQLDVRCKMFLYILFYNHLSCIISQYENRNYINKQMQNFFSKMHIDGLDLSPYLNMTLINYVSYVNVWHSSAFIFP